jgi:hypothetical protein
MTTLSEASTATAPSKRDVRAAEYRRLATAAGALAEATPLPHVREKHETAAARWTELAILDEQPTSMPLRPRYQPPQ